MLLLLLLNNFQIQNINKRKRRDKSKIAKKELKLIKYKNKKTVQVMASLFQNCAKTFKQKANSYALTHYNDEN